MKKECLEAIMLRQDLLILGNGFDLSCNLKSSYADFFKDRWSSDVIDYLRDLESEFYLICKNEQTKSDEYFDAYEEAGEYYALLANIPNNMNVWDLIIFFGRDSSPELWSDVEYRILAFLINDFSTQISLPNFEEMKEKINRGNMINLIVDEKKRSSAFLSKLVLFAAGKLKLDDPTKSELVLVNELKKFEVAFKDYMNKKLFHEQHIYSEYLENADRLLDKIVKYDPEENKKTNIISFNYTFPFLQSEQTINLEKTSKVQRRFEINNIHGKLVDSNIIFGIDQDKINARSFNYLFTKTYRRLVQNMTAIRDNQLTLPNPQNIERIIFFGHSLNSADYSYFQSIFDYYDIYSSSVTLVFYYSIYDKERELQIQQEHIIAVSDLIKHYGETMDNEAHGENLLHKLMLENRISITEIKVPFMHELV